MFRWGVGGWGSPFELGLQRYDLSGALAHDADPEAWVLFVVAREVGVELRLPLSFVEHKVYGPCPSNALVAYRGNLAVCARKGQRPVADVAVHQHHLAAVLH